MPCWASGLQLRPRYGDSCASSEKDQLDIDSHKGLKPEREKTAPPARHVKLTALPSQAQVRVRWANKQLRIALFPRTILLSSTVASPAKQTCRFKTRNLAKPISLSFLATS